VAEKYELAQGYVLMPEIDSFSFDKGINIRKNSDLLSEGELQACSGFGFDYDGYLIPLKPRAALTHTTYDYIHDIHRYMNWVLINENGDLRYKWDLREYCDQYTPASENFTSAGVCYAGRHKWVDYKDWVFGVSGHKNICFSRGSVYKWGIDNPANAPVVAAGSSGNPDGTYYCYVTFLVKFPNGEEYETDAGPYGTVSVSSKKISWSNIPICPYTGTGVVINRCLYRYSSNLGGIFYVATIGDNTTTTYTDNEEDAVIALNPLIATDTYSTLPDNLIDIELYLQRIFGIQGTYLYWTEPYLPFACKTTSNMNFSDNGDDLETVVYWGDQLYLASHKTWYRLPGTDPDTWAKKETYADHGIINRHTVCKTRYGIMGLGDKDGIYLFDGSTSTNITLKQLGRQDIFDAIYDHDDCWAEFDGRLYRFYYSLTSNVPDTCLIVDFTYYPTLRFYNDPFVATAYQHHKPSKRNYWAKSGLTYEEASSGGTAINLSLTTGDKVGQGILARKNLKYIYYDINTHGKDVTMTVYIDGTAHGTTFTLNETSRKRGRLEDIPYDMEGYRFAIGLSCASVTDEDLEIYAPFALEYTKAGV
jgi:hypothetical protein